jgi:NADPH2:quinone reductase
MTHAIRVHETGGPDVMKWEEIDTPSPGPGEVLVKHSAVGLNYIDVYFRTGVYPAPHLPFIPGFEGAGVVEAVGEGVNDFRPGDRVCYGTSPIGAYAEHRIMPVHHLLRLPDGIDETTAAAMMLQGMTVEYLIKRVAPVKKGDTVLFHAAAGGVGLIACQWLNYLGVEVIGTVGSAEKAELAKAHGAAHTINYRTENFVERVKEITGGKGVRHAYDSVGKDTFMDTLDCVAPFGVAATFGNASGPIEPFNPAILGPKGSLYVCRPTLFTFAADRKILESMANNLFEVVIKGAVKIEVNQTYALKDAVQAHTDLEGRKTTGSTVYTV